MKDEHDSRLGRRRLLQALAASVFACVRTQRPAERCLAANTLGGLCATRQHLVAFDNIHSADPLVVSPQCLDELQNFLREVPDHRKITFRSGGKSLDGQALNDDIVVLLTAPAFRCIGEVRLDAGSRMALITVGASATWGDILRKTTAAGYVPRAVPSAAGVTAGGSLSSHSISRFSPVWHKEGDHVRELKVVLPDGCLRTLRGDAALGDCEERRLFLGVVAGLGFLGAIVEVTYELLRVAPPRSTFFQSDDLWRDLLRTLQERAFDQEIVLRQAVTAASAPIAGAPPDGAGSYEDRPPLIIPEPASTIYASVWWSARGMQERALLAESRYVFDRDLSPMILYEPENELMGVVEDLLMTSSWLDRTLLDAATQEFASAAVAVTPIEGFTFFQDANLQVREHEYTGPSSVVLQQTFILPDPDCGAAFLADLTAFVRGGHELPTLCDVLWLPQDDNPFCLSATAQGGGFALTLTYVRPCDRVRPQIQRELKALTAKCLQRGGRIHLVKSVEVGSQADLERTYHAQFERFRALKARYDPHGKLINAFYHRVLGPPPGG